MKKALKHVMIIIPIAIAVFFISFAFEDKTTFEYNSTFEEQPAVYITKYGDCYHSIGCHYLNQSRIEKGLYEVQKSGYRECSYCGGHSYGTIQVEHREYYEVQYYRDAILYSALRMVVYTTVIYLLVLYCIYERSKNPSEEENCDRAGDREDT